MNTEIDTFLNDYKDRMIAFYTGLHTEYVNLPSGKEWGVGLRKLVDKHGKGNMEIAKYHMHDLEEIIDRDLANRKVAFVKRITDKAGEVESADLNIGVDGSINGTVTGDKATVNVHSIVAGGYNIQKAHYRVLVK
jgi:hypothetical protein